MEKIKEAKKFLKKAKPNFKSESQKFFEAFAPKGAKPEKETAKAMKGKLAKEKFKPLRKVIKIP